MKLVSPEAAKAICNEPEVPFDIATVGRNLKTQIAQLRVRYKQIVFHTNLCGAEEWLSDNFYVIEREGKESVRALRNWKRYSEKPKLGQVFRFCETLFGSGLYDICDENMARMSAAATEAGYGFTVGQFDFLPLAMQCVLVGLCHRAIFATADPKEATQKIAKGVTGLSRIVTVDFEELVGQHSPVEAILRGDPSAVYPVMTEDSRRQYRGVVARLALRQKRTEAEVAKDAINRAKLGTDERTRHVGYYLLRDWRRIAGGQRRGKVVLWLYCLLPLLGSVALGLAMDNGWLVLLCYLPLYEIVKTVLERAALWGIPPDILPRIDLAKAPEMAAPTAVVISTLLPKSSDSAELAKRLRQLYFANVGKRKEGGHLYFCVLADFKESDFPENPEDDAQARSTIREIEKLNSQYGDRFMLFIRRRRFNKTQGRYSGWERKRGAITEWIRFVKGEEIAAYHFTGDRKAAAELQYMIALDADTNLTFEAADRLLATAVHPLNRPLVDEERGLVQEGYGVLVPRLATELVSTKVTGFSRVMAGSGGVTAYDVVARDLYQDLFSEGIFSGKGIIDIDMFYRLLNHHFPENLVLSHDILEGAYLRTGFVADIEMTDGVPATLTSWLLRLHRWIRGDWQNLPFLRPQFVYGGQEVRNPITKLSRFKMLDNLRRSVTAPANMIALLAAACMSWCAAAWVYTIVTLSVFLGPAITAVASVMNGGMFTISHKYFVKTLPQALESLGQGLFAFIMLPAQGVKAMDAVIRTLYRLRVSGKKLLEWTTAAGTETGALTFWGAAKQYWLPTVLGGLFFLSPFWFAKVAGFLFLCIIPLAAFSSRPMENKKDQLTADQKERLLSYCAAMWQFYEDYADKSNHYLPPDNMQQAPVYRVAHRTSPTNIGLMLLSTLAARDFAFIDSAGLQERLGRTLDTVERLPTFHGNLYNWYDTQTLTLLHPAFVSTVDSGNFAACLVALAQGVREYISECPELLQTAKRIEAIVDGTDLTPFYCKKRHLFSLGYDADEEEMSGSHYDFLMSEARLTSYFALGRRQAPRRHWGALSRTMARCGSFAGPVSWTGTMFEYFMPHLLLPAYTGSLLDESLRYCAYCQRKRAKGTGLPWGISESGFFAFDRILNYQYKAHGVQWAGVKRGLHEEMVVSPYSTFLTVPFWAQAAFQNLQTLEKLGVYGQYGFFEAVDFTASRIGGAGLAVVRSYMAHHLGMSIVASANALCDGIMQKRFMADNQMGSAREFLKEKISKDAVVYDQLREGDIREKKPVPDSGVEPYENMNPSRPRAALLSNGGITHVFTDSGSAFIRYGNFDMTRRPDDLLRHPQGIFAFVQEEGKEAFSVTQAPFYDDSTQYGVTFEATHVTYTAQHEGLSAALRCAVHHAIPCEQFGLTLHNNSDKARKVSALFYFEPTLCRNRDYIAHAAFAKLFITARQDAPSGTITFLRRERDGQETNCLTTGFLEDIPFRYCLRREALFTAPKGFESLRQFAGLPFEGGGCSPDAACALRVEMLLPPGGSGKATMLLSVSKSNREGVDSIVSMRRACGPAASREGAQRAAAKSPLVNDSMEGQLGLAILGQLLFDYPVSQAQGQLLLENTSGQSTLWQAGISGDVPIVAITLSPELPMQRLEGYIRLQALLRMYNLEFDIAILVNSKTGEGEIVQAKEALTRCKVNDFIGAVGGVHFVDIAQVGERCAQMVLAAARHLPADGVFGGLEKGRAYRPAVVLPVAPMPLPPPEEGGLITVGGVFAQKRFYADRRTALPWCHILSNPAFGTLVSDHSLGFSWMGNSRENRLTPWTGDIAADHDGEMLIVKLGDKLYNLLAGARASFGAEDVVYTGMFAGIHSEVRVYVPAKGNGKICEVTLSNNTEREVEMMSAYYLEGILGVNGNTRRFVKRKKYHEGDMSGIVFENPYNTAARSAAALLCREMGAVAELNRRDFWEGRWRGEKDDQPYPDGTGALIVPLKLPPGRVGRHRFILAGAPTVGAALQMGQLLLRQSEAQNAARAKRQDYGYIQIHTPDKALDCYINHFAPSQIIGGRLWGRTGFYQPGGAFGFRDQLQDCCSYMAAEPAFAKTQILRCCAVQFLEGDVLHWWHNLPKDGGGLRGVRTRYSDDLLWMPYTAARYYRMTKDKHFLGTKVAYLSGDILGPQEQERYFEPKRRTESDSVYQHCLRAIEKGFHIGDNGLPFIGGGDWNDGFNQVGIGGKGQSVWLAMFLVMVLEDFAPVCEAMEEPDLAQLYRERAAHLRSAIDAHAWDGQWYLRAFYDDGEAMGGHSSDECTIDLLPQSFSVLCGMPNSDRVAMALDNGMKQLVDTRWGIVKLFDPPFQYSRQTPGYVKAYPAGLRENGGQYTHASVWFALALLERGRAEEGYQMLQMLNPAYRCQNPAWAAVYQTEPYYMAADIYSRPGCEGHGGWSIYTGAAGWYYRTVIEHLLGLRVENGGVTFHPRLPASWEGFSVEACIWGTHLKVKVIKERKSGPKPGAQVIPLDGGSHEATVYYEP